jgi:tRNA (cytidine/uridine-2'-O-)-methyltransferase
MKTPVHVIEPCGFPFSRRALQRYAMDYADLVDLHHHLSWEAFADWWQASGRRLVLLSTKAATPYTDFEFLPDDILMVGSESSGVPETVHSAVDARVTIPMHPDVRSLNVAVSMAMVLGEGLRQTASWPR